MKDERSPYVDLADVAEEAASKHRDGCPVREAYSAIARGARRAAATSTGPAQVASASYRDNYETIFGKRQPVGQA